MVRFFNLLYHKRKFSLLFFLNVYTILCSSNCYSQKNFSQQYNAQVIYELQYIPDSNNRKEVKTEYMELLVNDSMSLFRSINNGILDSILYLDFKNGKEYNPMLSFLQYRTPFFYNIVKSSNSTFYSEKIGSTYFSYQEPMNNFRWMLGSDTATISGFNCQKATVHYGNRNWIAWFSKDIPLSNGPYTFGGLPGLIVEIYDEQNFWHFLLTGIVNKSTTAIINYNKIFGYEVVHKNKLYKEKKYYDENTYEIMEAQGRFKGVKEENKLRSKTNLKNAAKRNNNWIEPYVE